MLNFTVGPVLSDTVVRSIGADQVPYFRTSEFSRVMLENEKTILEFANAPKNSRCAFITGSGTASMEAVVMNLFDANDKVIVVDGGSFGHRFCQLCTLHQVDYERLIPPIGTSFTKQNLAPFEGRRDFSAFIVNIDETSTGVLYDIDLIADFCNRNGLLLIVDAISSFLADPLDMISSGIDAMIAGSQKALACPPGISIITLSPRAIDKLESIPTKCMYLDLKNALKNGERGQTPFTPAVGTLLQIHARLEEIKKRGGVYSEIAKTSKLAADFRSKITKLPFKIDSKSLSNAVTPLCPKTAKATDIFSILKNEYDIWVCPNGGEYAEKRFRVGHIGALTTEDNDTLISAFRDMQSRGLI